MRSQRTQWTSRIGKEKYTYVAIHFLYLLRLIQSSKNPKVVKVSLRTNMSPTWAMDFKTLGSYRVFLEQIHGYNFVRKGKEMVLMCDQCIKP